MKHETKLDRIREDFEARQKNILFEDQHANMSRIHVSFEKNAREEQASRIRFGFLWLVLAFGLASIPFLCHFSEGTPAAFFVAIGPFLLSFFLFPVPRGSYSIQENTAKQRPRFAQ